MAKQDFVALEELKVTLHNSNATLLRLTQSDECLFKLDYVRQKMIEIEQIFEGTDYFEE